MVEICSLWRLGEKNDDQVDGENGTCALSEANVGRWGVDERVWKVRARISVVVMDEAGREILRRLVAGEVEVCDGMEE